MDEKVEISLRLKEFIEKKFSGNASSLANEMGITTQDLNKYTSGKIRVGIKQLLRLATIGCDLNWLLTGEPYMDSTLAEEFAEMKKEFEQLKKENGETKNEIKLLKNHNQLLIEQNDNLIETIKTVVEYSESLEESVRVKLSNIIALHAQNLKR